MGLPTYSGRSIHAGTGRRGEISPALRTVTEGSVVSE
jgi:hypothetical protein